MEYCVAHDVSIGGTTWPFGVALGGGNGNRGNEQSRFGLADFFFFLRECSFLVEISWLVRTAISIA